MCKYFSTSFGRWPTENLLHSPKTSVIKPFCECNNIRCNDVFILFVGPCAAGQFVRIDFGKLC